jgi:hypothetical protein
MNSICSDCGSDRMCPECVNAELAQYGTDDFLVEEPEVKKINICSGEDFPLEHL